MDGVEKRYMKLKIQKRDALLQFCTGVGLVIARTFAELQLKEVVITFRESDTLPFGPISETSHNILRVTRRRRWRLTIPW
eukprot:2055761-Pyramimonas_sp.AAC.1